MPSTHQNPDRTNCFLRSVILFGIGIAFLLPMTADAQLRSGSRPAPQTSKEPTRKASTRNVKDNKSPPTTATTNGNRVVAVVNGETVSRNQLTKECLRRYGKPVLESLVNKHLIFQECKRRNIHVTAEGIDQEIATIASKFNLSVDRWLALLKEERNISPEQYRRDIIWPTLALKQLVADKLEIPAPEIDKEFESEYGTKVQARMIAAESRQKAEALLAEVKTNPADFGRIAKNKSSDVNSAAAQGVIPPIRKHVGDKNIEQVAFALKPGDISPIIEYANQFIILKCERILEPTSISPQYAEVARSRLKDRILDRTLRNASAELSQKLQTSAKVVNVYNDKERSKQLPGVAAMINGEKITIQKLADECFERHGADLLESLVNQRILKQALQSKGSKVEQTEIKSEIERAAVVYGFVDQKGNPDLERWLKEVKEREGVTVETYVDDAVWPSVALKKLVSDQVQITDEDLKKGFEANYGEGVEILAIVLSNQRVANEVWELARAKKTKEFFGQLASQYSIEPVSRSNLGEVPPIRRFSGQKVVEDEAFELKPEDPLSGIVALGDRYIIMYYLGRTKPVVDDFNAVKNELSKEIREKKLRLAMAEEFDRLKDSAQIDNYLKGTTQSGKQTPLKSASRQNAASRSTSPSGSKGVVRKASTGGKPVSK